MKIMYLALEREKDLLTDTALGFRKKAEVVRHAQAMATN